MPFSYSPADLDRVVRTVYGEAANQGPVGQQAVAAVIRNRALQSGMSPTNVVLAKNQFEPWQTRAGELKALDPNSPKYQAIAAQVKPVLDGTAPDPTNGATHFLSPSAMAARGQPLPKWAQGPGTDIGGHRFFNLGYGGQGGTPSGGMPTLAQNSTPAPASATTSAAAPVGLLGDGTPKYTPGLLSMSLPPGATGPAPAPAPAVTPPAGPPGPSLYGNGDPSLMSATPAKQWSDATPTGNFPAAPQMPFPLGARGAGGPEIPFPGGAGGMPTAMANSPAMQMPTQALQIPMAPGGTPQFDPGGKSMSMPTGAAPVNPGLLQGALPAFAQAEQANMVPDGAGPALNTDANSPGWGGLGKFGLGLLAAGMPKQTGPTIQQQAAAMLPATLAAMQPTTSGLIKLSSLY